MPAAPAFTSLADTLTSKSFSASAQNALPSAAQRSTSNGAGSSGGSLPRFQEALEAARRPEASQEWSQPPAADSQNQAAADSSQESSTTGGARNDRRADRSRKRREKSQSDQSNADVAGDTQASRDASDSSAGAAGPTPTDASSADTAHKAPAAQVQKDSPTAPTAASTSTSAEAATAASAQATPAPPAKEAPVASPTGPSTADDGLVSGQAKVEKPSSRSKSPASPASKQPAEKPVLPHSDKMATAQSSDPDASPSDGPEDPPENSAPTALFQPVGKPGASIAPEKESPQDVPPQAPLTAQASDAQAVLAASAAIDLTAIAAPSDSPIDPEPPKPSVTGVPVNAGVGSHTPVASSQSADAAAPAQQLPPRDADQTFDQIVMGLRGKLDAQNGKAEIRLDPPNLGVLHVSISLEKGSLTAQFQSSSDVVRDLLKSNMEKLKSVLETRGIAVDHLAVEAPADKVVAAAARNLPANAPQNDGRSAGQYTRDQQSGQKRSQSAPGFTQASRASSNGAAMSDAPFDVVA